MAGIEGLSPAAGPVATRRSIHLNKGASFGAGGDGGWGGGVCGGGQRMG